MAVIRPYTEEHVPAVVELNRRLARGGSSFSFRTVTPAPGENGWSAFVAVDGDAVRGGYIGVKHRFRAGGEGTDVHHLKLPLSEGSVNRQYNAVGIQLLVDAQRRLPLAFALGMGGKGNALPKMLESLGWKVDDVRFFFRIARPSRFLRKAAFLRTSTSRRIMLDVAALSGAGAAILPLHAARDRTWWPPFAAKGEQVGDFGPWADRVWEAASGGYALLMRRGREELDRLYPPSDERFLRLRVDRRGKTIGWAVMLDTQLRGHKQFGDLRLGSLVDCLALPGEERWVVRAATRLLRRRGADLLVTNQSAAPWTRAMLANGWLEGPSNYALAMSKKLAARVGDGAIHMTRGDGDGPINL